MVSIKGLSRNAVIAALYNGSTPLGVGFMHFDPKPMTEADAAKRFDGQGYFDYLDGRVMKIRIDPTSDEIDPRLYDRDNGDGAAQRVIDELRATNDTNSDVIARRAQEATYASAQELKTHLHEWDKYTEDGDVATFTIGLSDVAPYLAPKLDAVLNDKTDADTDE